MYGDSYLYTLQNPLPGIEAQPSTRSIREWHFVIIGDKDSAFSGGIYHGTISFPEDYPFSPPSGIRMRTPNGRFQKDHKICLSITSHHPESWSPSWSISTILLGFQSFFYSNERTSGVLSGISEREIRYLASHSVDFNKNDAEFCALFPHLLEKEPGVVAKRKAPDVQQQQQQQQKKKNKGMSTANQQTVENTHDNVEIVYICDDVIDLTAD